MLSLSDQNMLLERCAKGREAKLIGRYIADGPTTLKEELELSDIEWRIIFDYLVFEHNLLYKTVLRASDFFQDNYVKYGMAHVRDIMNVSDDKYNLAMEVVFDFLAIANDGLYYHVLQHRDRYMIAFKARGGDFVRRILGIWKPKYEENWARILDLLLHSVCDDIFDERNFDEGLKAFSLMMNANRIHRPVEKSEMFRKI
ncbi:hypothetical protein HZA40_04110 [Candidatus Peregrinibacteria bacterium]|nr:hypothetical protein [Candidatus Peregrinibacteria bacterium]